MQENSSCGLVISITGPTACGRSKLMSGILERYPNFDAAMQVTTRPRRTIDDPSMTCVSQSEFDDRNAAGDFFQPLTNAYGYSYGIEKKSLLVSLSLRRHVVMIGHAAVFPHVSDSLTNGMRLLSRSVFLSPIPIPERCQTLSPARLDLFTSEVVNRLIERGSDQFRIDKTKEVIPARLAKWLRADHIIVNPGKTEGLEQALEVFAGIFADLQKEMQRPAPSTIMVSAGVTGLLIFKMFPDLIAQGMYF